MSLPRISIALALALGSSVTLAADPDQVIRQSLKSLDASLPIEAIAESPMTGIYQVQLEGGRQLYTSADGQFLFVGSGDSNLRKLRVSDGTVLWKTLAGGWPYVSGLDLTPDGVWLVAGTRSLDASLVRASDGLLQWQRETQYVDAVSRRMDVTSPPPAGRSIAHSMDRSPA